MDEMLSGSDLETFFNGDQDYDLLRYDDIDFARIAQEPWILEDKKLIILYPGYYSNEFVPNVGHYCGLSGYRPSKNRFRINFFDSYGSMPDDVYAEIKDPRKKYYKKLLKALFIAADTHPRIIVEFNPDTYQKKYQNSCGYWAGVRLKNYALSDDKFKKLIQYYRGRGLDIHQIYQLYR